MRYWAISTAVMAISSGIIGMLTTPDSAIRALALTLALMFGLLTVMLLVLDLIRHPPQSG
jgi:hypothetical protein